MTNSDIIDMINRSVEEIVRLRDEVARLRPAAEAYASIRKILNLLPDPPQGYGEDVVWRLRKQAEELEPKNEVPAP